ncbi:MAG: hypothetical protein HYZ11_14115 [Candidatus Tectomicrobia bacterium]|uniref:Uncharacterized protein n=1 Tax=Tectimicrobiota bacterium TaxID=2528274 RepID=A0A932I2J5_UNCTE|nr:hypothetical protein [Candidatus Tectomicrobia bacterium]
MIPGPEAFEAAREPANRMNLGCPFRVDFPGEGFLCFEPMGRTLRPPVDDAWCGRDPLRCPACQASLQALRMMLLRRCA